MCHRTTRVQLALVVVATVLGVVRGDVDAPVQMDKCPAGAAVIRSNTTDVRCLPHQIGTCVAAAIRAGLIVDLQSINSGDMRVHSQIADLINSICCWNNHVDYYCCINVLPSQCPAYDDVTMVIHKPHPQSPFAPSEYIFPLPANSPPPGSITHESPGIAGFVRARRDVVFVKDRN